MNISKVQKTHLNLIAGFNVGDLIVMKDEVSLIEDLKATSELPKVATMAHKTFWEKYRKVSRDGKRSL